MIPKCSQNDSKMTPKSSQNHSKIGRPAGSVRAAARPVRSGRPAGSRSGRRPARSGRRPDRWGDRPSGRRWRPPPSFSFDTRRPPKITFCLFRGAILSYFRYIFRPRDPSKKFRRIIRINLLPAAPPDLLKYPSYDRLKVGKSDI